jgi:hypothetical protein
MLSTVGAGQWIPGSRVARAPRNDSGGGLLETSMSDGFVSRFLGGPPLWVLARLVLLSILVGVILAAFGFDPWNIVRSIERLARAIYDMGFDAIFLLWRYFLLGAVLVIPIWLVMRLIKAPAARR